MLKGFSGTQGGVVYQTHMLEASGDQRPTSSTRILDGFEGLRVSYDGVVDLELVFLEDGLHC